MSDPVSALLGADFEGFCQVKDAGLVGMITLRADLSLAKVAKAVKSVTGAEMPDQGAVTKGKAGRVAWMSPDELLLIVGHTKAPAMVTKLEKALVASHALVVNVSDARAVFHVQGKAARDVIAKLSPTDLRGFEAGVLRRTRFAQVPAAFHMLDDGSIEVVCFRSVSKYMFDLLSNAARKGSEL